MHPHRPLKRSYDDFVILVRFFGAGPLLKPGSPHVRRILLLARSGSCRWKRRGAAGLGRRTILAARLAGYPSARFIRGALALLSYAPLGTDSTLRIPGVAMISRDISSTSIRTSRALLCMPVADTVSAFHGTRYTTRP